MCIKSQLKTIDIMEARETLCVISIYRKWQDKLILMNLMAGNDRCISHCDHLFMVISAISTLGYL